MEDDEDAASNSSAATSVADQRKEDIVQSSKQLRAVHQVENTEGSAPSTNRKTDACVIDCKGGIYRRNRHLYDTIANQETKNAHLKAEAEGVSKRFEMMEIIMPALMARDILRHKENPDFSLVQFLNKKLQVDQGYFPLLCEPSNHHNVQIRELEAEKKKEKQRLEEARSMWEEIQKILEQKKRERNELVRINEELELKYDDLVDELQEKKKKEKERECDGFNCLELGLGESESATSITSASLECIIKLQEVAETTLCMKRNIADLERRECEYIQTLQCAGQILSKTSEIGKKDLKWKQKLCPDENLSDREYLTCSEDSFLGDSDYEGEPCPRGTQCFDKLKSQKPLTRTKNDLPIKTKEWRSLPREGAVKVDKAADPVLLEGQGDSVGDNLRRDGRLVVPKEKLESWLEIAEKMHSVVSNCSEAKLMEPVVEIMRKEISTHLKRSWKEKKRSVGVSSRRFKDQQYPKRKGSNSLEANTSAVLPLIEKVSSKEQQRESKMKRAKSSTLEVENQSPVTRDSLQSFDASPRRSESRKRKYSNVDEIEKERKKSISVSTDDLKVVRSQRQSKELPSRDSKSRNKFYEEEKEEEKYEDLKVDKAEKKSGEFQEENEFRRSSGQVFEEMRSEPGIPGKMRKKESVSETGDKKSLDKMSSKNFDRPSMSKDYSDFRSKGGSELSQHLSLRSSSKSQRILDMSSSLPGLQEKTLEEEESTVHSVELEKVNEYTETSVQNKQKDSRLSANSEEQDISSENIPRSGVSAQQIRRFSSNLEELQSPPSSRISKSSKISYVSLTKLNQGRKTLDDITSSVILGIQPKICHIPDRHDSKKSFSCSESLVGQEILEENVSGPLQLSENIKPENLGFSPENILDPFQISVEQTKVPSVQTENSLTTRKTPENSSILENSSPKIRQQQISVEQMKVPSVQTENSLTTRKAPENSFILENSSPKIRQQSLLQNIDEIQEPGFSLFPKSQSSLDEVITKDLPTSSNSSGTTSSHHKRRLTSFSSKSSAPKEEKVFRKSESSDNNKKSQNFSPFSRRTSNSDYEKQISDSNNKQSLNSQKFLGYSGPTTERRDLTSEGLSEPILELDHPNLEEPIILSRISPEGLNTDDISAVQPGSQFQIDQPVHVKVPSISENSLNSSSTSNALTRLDSVRNPSSYLTILKNEESVKESESHNTGRSITTFEKFQQEMKDSNDASKVLRVDNLLDRSAFAADDRNKIPASVTNGERILGQSNYLQKETREYELPKAKNEETAAESIPELIEFVEQSNEEMRRFFRNSESSEGVQTAKDNISRKGVSEILKPQMAPSAVCGNDEKPTRDRETKKSPNHIRITIGENLSLSRLRHLLDDFQLDRIIASQPLDQPRRLSRRSKLKLRVVCADSQTPSGGCQKNIPSVANYYKFQNPMRSAYSFSSGDSESESICKCGDSETEESFARNQSDWSFLTEEKPRTLACTVKRIT